MKILAIATAAAVAMTGTASVAWAQDVEAEKRENVTTYAIYMVQLNPGQAGAFADRVKILNEVSESLGVEPATIHHMATGRYDRMVVVEVEEGMAALDWETTPSDARFQNAMIERMGKEEYQKWQMGWMEVMERPTTMYSHVHN